MVAMSNNLFIYTDLLWKTNCRKWAFRVFNETYVSHNKTLWPFQIMADIDKEARVFGNIYKTKISAKYTACSVVAIIDNQKYTLYISIKKHQNQAITEVPTKKW